MSTGRKQRCWTHLKKVKLIDIIARLTFEGEFVKCFVWVVIQESWLVTITGWAASGCPQTAWLFARDPGTASWRYGTEDDPQLVSRQSPAKTCRVDADEEFREKFDFRGRLSEKPHGVKGECLNLCQVLFAVRGGVGWAGWGLVGREGLYCEVFPSVMLWFLILFTLYGFIWLRGRRVGGASATLFLLTVDGTEFSHQQQCAHLLQQFHDDSMWTVAKRRR